VSTSFSSPALSASPSSSSSSPSTGAARRSYKVLAAIQRYDGQGEWLMRVGTAYQNRDESINIYLDALPLAGSNGKIRLQIRELDANDLARREQYRASAAAAARGHDPAAFAPPPPSGGPPAAANDLPF
jgi:hypothetical protein